MKTESQKLRASLPFSEDELAKLLEELKLPFSIDAAGKVWTSFENLTYIANRKQRSKEMLGEIAMRSYPAATTKDRSRLHSYASGE